MAKLVIPFRADINVLKDKQARVIFTDIARHRAHTPEEITTELNLDKTIVLTSLKALTDAELITPTSSLPTSAGTMTFYSPSREGIKLMRAIEGGYDIGFD